MLIASGFLFLAFSIKFVSAQAAPNQYMQMFIDWANSNFGPFFQALLGTPSIDSFLFAKIMMLILLFCVVSLALGRFPLFEGRKGIVSVVSLVFAIMAVRFLKEDAFITMIFLPIGGAGAAIISFLMFAVVFIFIHSSIPSSFGRRVAWSMYAAYFVALWYVRFNDPSSGLSTTPIVNWVYPLTIIFIVIAILMDKLIHSIFKYGEFEKAREHIDLRARLQTLEDLDRARRVGNVRDVQRLERRMRGMNWPI